MNEPTYEEKLAAWKLRMGVPLDAQSLPDSEQVMIAEDAKDDGRAYCVECGEEFPIKEMRVETDPYIQYEDEPYRADGPYLKDGYIPAKYRLRKCLPCWKESNKDAP